MDKLVNKLHFEALAATHVAILCGVWESWDTRRPVAAPGLADAAPSWGARMPPTATHTRCWRAHLLPLVGLLGCPSGMHRASGVAARMLDSGWHVLTIQHICDRREKSTRMGSLLRHATAGRAKRHACFGPNQACRGEQRWRHADPATVTNSSSLNRWLKGENGVSSRGENPMHRLLTLLNTPPRIELRAGRPLNTKRLERTLLCAGAPLHTCCCRAACNPAVGTSTFQRLQQGAAAQGRGVRTDHIPSLWQRPRSTRSALRLRDGHFA
jgi:hypothetical protein